MIALFIRSITDCLVNIVFSKKRDAINKIHKLNTETNSKHYPNGRNVNH
ncbi:MAG: hypothetical protein AB7G44_03515 [Bacteroidia bacterium]